jgi:hypothetical protein
LPALQAADGGARAPRPHASLPVAAVGRRGGEGCAETPEKPQKVKKDAGFPRFFAIYPFAHGESKIGSNLFRISYLEFSDPACSLAGRNILF